MSISFGNNIVERYNEKEEEEEEELIDNKKILQMIKKQTKNNKSNFSKNKFTSINEYINFILSIKQNNDILIDIINDCYYLINNIYEKKRKIIYILKIK